MAKQTKTTKKSLKLGECNSQAWLESTQTRPKQVAMLFSRTQKGYLLEEAKVVNTINQHTTEFITMDVRSIKSDLNKKGITTR